MKKILVSKKMLSKNIVSERVNIGGVELMSVKEGGRGEGISLCVKFKTSWMLPSGIFWWGCFVIS